MEEKPLGPAHRELKGLIKKQRSCCEHENVGLLSMLEGLYRSTSIGWCIASDVYFSYIVDGTEYLFERNTCQPMARGPDIAMMSVESIDSMLGGDNEFCPKLILDLSKEKHGSGS